MIQNRTIFSKALVVILIAFSTLFVSCSKDDDFGISGKDAYSNHEDLGNRLKSEETRKVMILYSAGFNSLSSYLSEDIEDLKKGYLPGNSRNDNVLLIFSRQPVSSGNYAKLTSPCLIKMYKDEQGNAVMDTLLRMSDSTVAVSPTTMKKVLTYVKENFPAKGYGMVFSSHASGWLPAGYYSNPSDYEKGMDFSTYSTSAFSIKRNDYSESYNYMESQSDPSLPAVKSIGQDLTGVKGSYVAYEMNLNNLSDAFPMHFDYILFDACLMGGVEVAYQLKDVCDKIGFSQTEVLAEGLDYTNITSHLLEPTTPDVLSVCKEYFDYYNSQSGQYRSATFSLIDCNKMDNLASVCKTIFAKDSAAIAKVNPADVQVYFRFNRHWFYDLQDILVKAGIPQSDLSSLQSALDACVLYKAATPSFINAFDISTYCGFSMYLPDNGSTYLSTFYKTLAWDKATNLVK